MDILGNEKKYKLLEKYFTSFPTNTGEIEPLEKFRKKLENYLRNESDDQIRDVLRLVNLYIEEKLYWDFEEAVKIMRPTIIRLLNLENWDLYDIRILQTAITYGKTFEECQKLITTALIALEKYNNHPLYFKIKLALHMNILVRLIKAQFLEVDPIEMPMDSKKLKEAFDQHVKMALALCKDKELKTYRIIILIREALFHRNYEEVDKNLNALKETGEKDVYNAMKEAVNYYNTYAGTDISKKQVDTMIGANLRKLRLSLNQKPEDFAEIMNISTSSVLLIERGERTLTSYGIVMLTRTLDINPNDLFTGIADEEVLDSKSAMVEIIKARAQKLSDTSIVHINNTIDLLIQLEKELKLPKK
ncbi:MAG: helix-turn-helix domain-containing protein [Defluviitaleaceae bacterium]|nr:helix-turn-helix domain-containing protein [Defluviitaleaceae bacterium]